MSFKMKEAVADLVRLQSANKIWCVLIFGVVYHMVHMGTNKQTITCTKTKNGPA